MPRIVTVLLALTIDLTLGDPPNRFHPVVLMGHWLTAGRHLAPLQKRFWFGAGWITAGIALFSIPFWKLENRKLIYPLSFILHPFLLKPVFAYRNLRRTVSTKAH